MCHFISWIDLEGQLYYLTSKELRSKRGKELKEYLGSAYADDVVGHGAIDWYYDLKGLGVHKECTNFSSPANFPDEIVRKIKSGAFMGMGVCPELLNKAALAEYERIRQPAWAEYEKIAQPAWAEYKRVEQSAWAEYEKIQQLAWAEYKRVEQSALAEYEKIQQTTFWRLISDAKNRSTAWA